MLTNVFMYEILEHLNREFFVDDLNIQLIILYGEFGVYLVL